MKILTQFLDANNESNKVFLGGTCNESTWRDELIPKLEEIDFDYFNPVVEDWIPECQEIEIYEKENNCNIHLYVITNKMKGVFSIAEAIESVFNKDKKTIFCVLDGFDGDFPDYQVKSLEAVGRMVERNGGKYVTSFGDIIEILNTCK